MQLKSYVQGRWHVGRARRAGAARRHDGTGDRRGIVERRRFRGRAASTRVDKGGPALRDLTFHERAALLKRAREAPDRAQGGVLHAVVRDRRDQGRLLDRHRRRHRHAVRVRESRVRASCRTAACTSTATSKVCRRPAPSSAQHICVPLEGAAMHINAFNFPVWGMLEKLAPTLLAGMPAIVKPATTTAYLTELVVRRIIESGILPEGALQLVCGSLGDLFDHLTCQDVVSFTGSASTAQKLRTHPTIVANSVRFISETDSINSCVLGPDAAPGQPEFDAFVREVVREMTAKAGPEMHRDPQGDRAGGARRSGRAGDQGGAREDRRRRSASASRCAWVRSRRSRSVARCSGRIAELQARSRALTGEAETLRAGRRGSREGCVRRAGAAVLSRADRRRKPIHTVEAFGPVCTVVPYASVSDAIAYARGGEGSLVGSVFTADDDAAVEFALGLAPLHGRLLIVNRDCAKESTGHGSPLPGLVHGGPGRAGGGEEMGGIRGVMHYMQRTAIQGSPQTDRARSPDAGRAAPRRRRPACTRSASRSTSCRSATR